MESIMTQYYLNFASENLIKNDTPELQTNNFKACPKHHRTHLLKRLPAEAVSVSTITLPRGFGVDKVFGSPYVTCTHTEDDRYSHAKRAERGVCVPFWIGWNTCDEWLAQMIFPLKSTVFPDYNYIAVRLESGVCPKNLNKMFKALGALPPVFNDTRGRSDFEALAYILTQTYKDEFSARVDTAA